MTDLSATASWLKYMNSQNLDSLPLEELESMLKENQQHLISIKKKKACIKAKQRHQLKKLKAARYRNPEKLTQTWSGFGRKPNWVREAEQRGENIAKFSVFADVVKYRNPKNPRQVWNGMGLKPAWLLKAESRGKNIEVFLVQKI